MKNSAQKACLELRRFACQMYSKLRWLMSTVKGCRAPSNQSHHSSDAALMTISWRRCMDRVYWDFRASVTAPHLIWPQTRVPLQEITWIKIVKMVNPWSCSMAERTMWWERPRIFNHDRVKPPVIYTRAESAILLLHKKETSGGRRRGPANEPLSSASAT